MWQLFRKYHYLNTDMHNAAQQYIGVIGSEIVCHTGVIQFPMRKGWKRIHRLVVLPDYQGVGVGTAFITAVAGIVSKQGYKVNLTTTTPQLVHALAKQKQWLMVRSGRAKGSGLKNFSKYGLHHKHLADAESRKRITYSFNYAAKERG